MLPDAFMDCWSFLRAADSEAFLGPDRTMSLAIFCMRMRLSPSANLQHCRKSKDGFQSR